MAKTSRFQIVFHSRIKVQLDEIERKHHSLIRNQINEQLSYEPEVKTRNRKPVVQPFPFDATWEIRFGPQNRIRVFYEVDRSEGIVSILAIGEKRGNRLFIGGEEIDL
jgi:mRNA-degrading endonuclease RelE of RelBE toxin-antitoxin system